MRQRPLLGHHQGSVHLNKSAQRVGVLANFQCQQAGVARLLVFSADIANSARRPIMASYQPFEIS
jgi:hypothetical protein